MKAGVATKVINRLGDEVMKAFAVDWDEYADQQTGE